MPRLLLVDMPNVVMRQAYGGQVEPKAAAPLAVALVRRAIGQLEPTHLIAVYDSLAPSWRKRQHAAYKAHRETETVRWCVEAEAAAAAEGWCNDLTDGWEADDTIATRARKAAAAGVAVYILSSDSDLLACLVDDNVTVVAPQKGQEFAIVSEEEAADRYQLLNVAQLPDFKALVGERGDLGPDAGVPGIGPKKAAHLLRTFVTLDSIIAAGAREVDVLARVVWTHRDKVRAERALLELRFDVPVRPIPPTQCALVGVRHAAPRPAMAPVAPPASPAPRVSDTCMNCGGLVDDDHPNVCSVCRGAPPPVQYRDGVRALVSHAPPGEAAKPPKRYPYPRHPSGVVNVDLCTTCGREVVWGRTDAKRPVPLDYDPGATEGVSHFTTCEDAARHSKRARR